MRLTSGGHLTYCLNVHPGETWDDVLQTVRIHVPEVKARISPDQPFGVGLRLSGTACEESRGRETELKQALEDAGAYAFTVNAFPHGAFHDTRVKETVYLPDWSSPVRTAYTLRAAEILAAVLPEGMEGSVSTVPLGYKYGRWEMEGGRPGVRNQRSEVRGQRRYHFTNFPISQYTKLLVATATGLAELEARTGRFIHLGLEPEPDCLLETTEETLEFFRELFQHPKEEILRRYLGVCLDTCHVALQFEDPAESLRRFRREGIRISKIQLSAALEAEARRIAPADLQPFNEGVYFHQTTSSSGRRWRDLPDWMTEPDPEAGTLRVHCHVPLDWEGSDRIRSTRHTLTPAFWEEVRHLEAPHLEVETYTFEGLPAEVKRDKGVTENMAGECAWALRALRT